MKLITTFLFLFTFLIAKGQGSYLQVNDTLGYELTGLEILNDTFSFVVINHIFGRDTSYTIRDRIQLLYTDNTWSFIRAVEGRLEERTDTIVQSIWKY